MGGGLSVSVLKQLHFHLVGKFFSGTTVTLTWGTWSVAVQGNDLAVLHIILSKFLNKKTVPPHSFKIMHLCYVVEYPMDSQEKNLHMEHSFCLQIRIGGII